MEKKEKKTGNGHRQVVAALPQAPWQRLDARRSTAPTRLTQPRRLAWLDVTSAVEAAALQITSLKAARSRVWLVEVSPVSNVSRCLIVLLALKETFFFFYGFFLRVLQKGIINPAEDKRRTHQRLSEIKRLEIKIKMQLMAWNRKSFFFPGTTLKAREKLNTFFKVTCADLTRSWLKTLGVRIFHVFFFLAGWI